MPVLDELRVRQLDQALGRLRVLRHRPPPDEGWIRTIREALGMSLRQLARRADLSKTSVTRAEKTEQSGRIQLGTLRRLAEGLDCDLVYALVPRHSLRESLDDQAERTAQQLVDSVSESMELEDQGVARSERERQVRELASQMVRERKRDFWDV